MLAIRRKTHELSILLEGFAQGTLGHCPAGGRTPRLGVSGGKAVSLSS